MPAGSLFPHGNDTGFVYHPTFSNMMAPAVSVLKFLLLNIDLTLLEFGCHHGFFF